MCMSSPKIPDPVPPPAAPPPPTAMAKTVRNKPAQTRKSKAKSGMSSLTIRRPSVNVASSGTGANVAY
jgi:hypothetical protein